MSTSSNPTFLPDVARAIARFAATVLLPTPPLPESTSTLNRMRLIDLPTASSSADGTGFRLSAGPPGAAPAAPAASLQGVGPHAASECEQGASCRSNWATAAHRVFKARTAQCLWSSGNPPAASSTCWGVTLHASANVLPEASLPAMAPLRTDAPQPSVVKLACKMRSASTRSQNSMVSPQGPFSRALVLAPFKGPKLTGSCRN